MYEPSDPILTHLLAEEWAAKPDKPTARGTKFRYSSAYDCARKMSYLATNVEPTNPMDEGDAWAPGLGTMIHEKAQEAILRAYPTARFEVSSERASIISGSCDALIPTADILLKTGLDLGGDHVLWELKTMGDFAFDKQVGWKRQSAQFRDPEGPSPKAITQAGINACGIESEQGVDIQTILMGSLCLAPLSVQKANRMRLRGFDRIGAEFRIPRLVWFEMAEWEMARIYRIDEMVEHGEKVPRDALDDHGKPETLDPLSGNNWQCHYCPFYERCTRDGE